MGELQQFLCAPGWMRSCIPNFAREALPLQQCLQNGLIGTNRTAKAAKLKKLEFNNDERVSFHCVKTLLENSVMLAYQDATATICLFTDASDTGWGIAITQVLQWVDNLGIPDQQHEPLLFLSGAFKGAQLHWSVIEKEGYPIVVAIEKADYLLHCGKPFKLFCDHANLVSIFAPDKETKRHVSAKLYRWSMKLLALEYEVTHISGKDNIWADLFSRWMATPETNKGIKSVRRRSTYIMDDYDHVHALQSDEYEYPKAEDIIQVQSNYSADLPSDAVPNNLGIYIVDDLVWIPPGDSELTLRLMIAGHCGPQGHRGCQALILILKRRFMIDKLDVKCRNFTTNCLVCLQTKGGKTIPRPWSGTNKLAKRNERLHWDYLYIGNSTDDYQYILVMKDEASHYGMLEPCVAADAETTAASLLKWSSLFGHPEVWVSDTATHFKNQTLDELSLLTGSKQDFILAYCPWRNGTVERVNRDILQVIKAIMLELKIPHDRWPKIVHLIQQNLNSTPVATLDGLAPMEVFTGLHIKTQIDSIIIDESDEPITVNIEHGNIVNEVNQLRISLNSIHDVVSEKKERRRLRQQLAKAGKSIEANFMVGDYVLWSKVDRKLPNNKLQVTWLGPYIVTWCGPYSCRIKHLLNEKEHEVHDSRLKFYRDSSLNVTETLLAHVANQATLLQVNQLVGHKKINGKWHILVNWRGLEVDDNSYEPIENIAYDIPVMLKEYLNEVPESELRTYGSRLGRQCGISYPFDISE